MALDEHSKQQEDNIIYKKNSPSDSHTCKTKFYRGKTSENALKKVSQK